jgi:hypothetical protein
VFVTTLYTSHFVVCGTLATFALVQAAVNSLQPNWEGRGIESIREGVLKRKTRTMLSFSFLSDLEVPYLTSTPIGIRSINSYAGHVTAPACSGASYPAGRGPTRTDCLECSQPSWLEFKATGSDVEAQSSSGAQMAATLAREPLTQRCPSIRSTSSVFFSGSGTGHSISLQPPSFSWCSPRSLESSRTGSPGHYYPFPPNHLSWYHWTLACSRADPPLALPFLAAYPEAR